MCGIIGMFNTNKQGNVSEKLAEAFMKQRERGTKGFGLLTINADNTVNMHRSVHEAKAVMDIYEKKAPMAIFHHRTPTSSDNLHNQTHPIRVVLPNTKHTYYICHNGVIDNAEKIYEKHEKEDIEYSTLHKEGNDLVFNDSEALAVELALFMEGKIDALRTEGTAAVLGVQLDLKGHIQQVFFGHNSGNPLTMQYNPGHNFIEIRSVGTGNDVKENMLYSFNLTDFKLKKKPLEFKDRIIEAKTYAGNYNYQRNYYDDDDMARTIPSREIGFTTEKLTPHSRLEHAIANLTDLAIKDMSELLYDISDELAIPEENIYSVDKKDINKRLWNIMNEFLDDFRARVEDYYIDVYEEGTQKQTTLPEILNSK